MRYTTKFADVVADAAASTSCANGRSAVERCGTIVMTMTMDTAEEELRLIRGLLDQCTRNASSAHDIALLIRLGHVLLRLGRRPEAMAAAVRAQATCPSTAHWLDALGTLLTHLEEPVMALPYFEQAVMKAPENTDYHYNLAMAQRMTGDLQQSEINLDLVITARPNDGEAFHARSGLRKQTAEKNHVPQLEQALANLRGKRAAVPIAFALAKELEDLGEYSRSFAILQSVNAAYRKSLRYDVATDITVLNVLRQHHTKKALEALHVPFDSEECIFIIGLPRTGTTLLERILGQHSQIYPAGELDAFSKVAIDAVTRNESTAATKIGFAARLLEVDFSKLGPHYLAATRPRTGRTLKFTDKFPLNYLYAGVISAALPRARFIAMHRNPMDSCYAMYKTLFASAYPFSYDLNDLGLYYLAWRRLMEHWRDVIGERWLDIHYEDLVLDVESVGKRVIGHCRLPWEDKCLEFHTGAGGVTTASAAQVRSPIRADSVGIWRHYEAQLAPLSALFKSTRINADDDKF